MTAYVQPTMSEIEGVVAGAKRRADRESMNTQREKWYDWTLPPTNQGPKLAVRWYTSVVEAHGVARDCGKDAMRVVIVKSPGSKNERVLFSMTRIHRTPGWEKRVQERIKIAYTLLKKGPVCPACGARMTPKAAKSKNRKKVLRLFWSCTRFPDCKGTRTGCKEPYPKSLLKTLEATNG